MSSQKGARSKLADVLADIKNSRGEDEYEYSSHDTTAPTKTRRSTVNYVALSGHNPRQSRSSAANHSTSQSTNNEHKASTTPASLNSTQVTTPTSNPRHKTCILKLFDRSVDLAQFCSGSAGTKEPPLYPICRAWIHGHKTNQTTSASPTTTNSNNQPKSIIKQPSKSNDKSNVASPNPQDNNSTSEVVDEIHSMPLPKTKSEAIKRFSLDIEDDGIDLRIPQTVQKFTPSQDLVEVFDKTVSTMDRDECLQLNKQHWKRVKKDWSEARRIHDWRYEESFKILRDSLISAQQSA